MERTQFTFYESFYRSIARMKKKSDQADAFIAIARLALYGEMPDLDAMPDMAASALENIIPIILASNRKAENGKKGGSKSEANDKQNGSKTEAKRKQTRSEKENEKENEIEIENECLKKRAKQKYGQYHNVLLTDEEYAALKSEFADVDERIERLSEYIASKGVKYKSHIATIRAWARKDGATKQSRPAPSRDAYDDVLKALEQL